jgi:hypothetical protein
MRTRRPECCGMDDHGTPAPLRAVMLGQRAIPGPEEIAARANIALGCSWNSHYGRYRADLFFARQLCARRSIRSLAVGKYGHYSHSPQRPHCLAAVEGLELRNPCESHVFEML